MPSYVNIRSKMKNKQVPFLIVGILIGFVGGFFLGQGVVEPVPGGLSAQSPPAQSQSAQSQSALPENHPSPEFIEQLQSLEVHAGENKSDVEARVALGNAYYDMSRFDLAIRWYEEAMTLDDQNPDMVTDLGTAHFYSGNPEKAIELFRHSLELEVDHPQTLQNLGWVQFQSENLQAAAEAWERLIRVHPDYEQIEAVKQQLDTLKQHLKGDHS